MADDLGKLLLAAADMWQAELRRILANRAPAGSLGAGGAVLPHLDSGGLSQTALTTRMGLSKQAVQQLLDHLEAQGLVRRAPDPADKRVKRVHITASGTEAFVLRQAAETALQERLRENLGKKRYKALRKALRDLAAV